MTNSITDRLKTSTPSLLPRAEWPMSKGSLTLGKRFNQGGSGYYTYVVYCASPHSSIKRGFQIAEFNIEADANFYCACNSEPPLVETLWEAYHCLQSNKESETFNGCYVNEYMEETALRLLTHLDAMSVLRWTPKEGE